MRCRQGAEREEGVRRDGGHEEGRSGFDVGHPCPHAMVEVVTPDEEERGRKIASRRTAPDRLRFFLMLNVGLS